MSHPSRQRICFIIGPMSPAYGEGANARLRRLATTVVEPLLRSLNETYRVITPFDIPGAGLIMNDVIQMIDQADLVIADLTENNPNVFYELSLCHAMGVPTITLFEEMTGTKPIAFDLSAYRHIKIKLDETNNCIVELLPHVRHVIDQMNHRRVLENPITTYYREAITNISPAAGLAQAYFQNFVRPTVERIKAMNPDQTEHIYNLEVREGPESSETIIPLGKALDVRRDLSLLVIIPDQLDFTTEDRISQVKRTLSRASIQTERRPLTTLARKTAKGYQLVDIPSIMNVMIASIDRRAGQLQVRRDSPRWQQLEQDEVDRFQFELEQWSFHQREYGNEFVRRIKIVRYSHTQVSDEMLWLRNIWVD